MLKNVTVMMVLVFLVLTGCQGKKENSSGKNETSTQGTPPEEAVTPKEEKEDKNYRYILVNFLKQYPDRMTAGDESLTEEIDIYIDEKHFGVFDFEALFSLPEKALDYVSGFVVYDLNNSKEFYSKINKLKKLKGFAVYNDDEFTELRQINFDKLNNIEGIGLNNVPITSLVELSNCPSLRKIGIRNCPVTKLADFSKFINIERIALINTSITSLQGLETFHGQYGEVDIRDNPNLTDITALKDTDIKLLRMDEELYNNNKEWIEANIPDMKIDTTPLR